MTSSQACVTSRKIHMVFGFIIPDYVFNSTEFIFHFMRAGSITCYRMLPLCLKISHSRKVRVEENFPSCFYFCGEPITLQHQALHIGTRILN